ncbi:hypothetical protein BT96DRAFT_154404 [Gymnopus androsaceus JB14]|uniref:Uncharacterized protein n=1 Tax=Gymnopus androsaceus JB14 TaxID=1447944 RepID=A0A6A4HBH8_9AGAR|nr:hypothetical protein BT96DRAFT_154404 [Gymnopus androsaceus JB14]
MTQETETTNTHARDREMQRIRVEHPDTRSLDDNAASASVAGFPTSPSSFATTFAASSSLTHASESSSAYTGSRSSRAPGKQIAGHTQTHSVTMLTLPSNGSHASGFPASPSSMATSFTYAQSHSTHAHTDLGTETETDGHTLISHSESASEAGYGYGYKSGLGKDKGSKETGTETESLSETHGYGFSTRYSAVPAGEKDQRFDSDSEEERSEDTHTGDGDFISSYMEGRREVRRTHIPGIWSHRTWRRRLIIPMRMAIRRGRVMKRAIRQSY